MLVWILHCIEFVKCQRYFGCISLLSIQMRIIRIIWCLWNLSALSGCPNFCCGVSKNPSWWTCQRQEEQDNNRIVVGEVLQKDNELARTFSTWISWTVGEVPRRKSPMTRIAPWDLHSKLLCWFYFLFK
jgi:hypothetical protein